MTRPDAGDPPAVPGRPLWPPRLPKILRDRPDLAICLGLSLLAAGLRLYGLDQGLWFDEIKSLKLFLRAPWLDLLAQPAEPTHQPFYALLAKLSITILGENEWTLRLPAFLFGVATVPLTYLFGKKWVGARAGLIAALFMGVGMWPVWFSQDARSYAPMIFFSLLATHDFLGLAVADWPWRQERRRALRYAVSAGFAIYAHPYSGAVMLAHLLIALSALRDARARAHGLRLAATALGGLAFGGLLYAPLLPALWGFAAHQGQVTVTRGFSPRFVPELFSDWSAGVARPLWSWLIIAPAVLGLVLVAKKNRRIVWTWLFALGFGLVVPVLAHIFLYHRFYSFDLPGFYLFAATGIDWTMRRPGAFKWLGRALLAAALVALAVNLGVYYHEGKQAFRPAAEWARENAVGYRPLTVGLSGEVLDYYLPEVTVLPSGRLLDPRWLAHSVVIVSHPWSVGRENFQVLQEVCGPPVIFPSAGYEENEVRIYKCE